MWTSEPDEDSRRERLSAPARCQKSLERDVEGLLEAIGAPALVVRPSDGRVQIVSRTWRERVRNGTPLKDVLPEVGAALARADAPPVGYEWRSLGPDRMLVIERQSASSLTAGTAFEPGTTHSAIFLGDETRLPGQPGAHVWSRIPSLARRRSVRSGKTRTLAHVAATGLEMIEATLERVAQRTQRPQAAESADGVSERKSLERGAALQTLINLGALARKPLSRDQVTTEVVQTLQDGLRLVACAALTGTSIEDNGARVVTSSRLCASAGNATHVESLCRREATVNAMQSDVTCVKVVDDGRFFIVCAPRADETLVFAGQRETSSLLFAGELEQWGTALGGEITLALELANARHELKGARAFMSSALDALPDAVIITDTQGRISEANLQSQHILRQANLSIGDDARALFRLLETQGHARHARKLDGVVSRALGGEHVVERAWYEESDTRKRRDVALHAMPIPPRHNGALLVVEDLTQSQELDRLKESFVSMAAHELRTPLATVKAWTQSTLRDGEKNGALERAHQTLEAIGQKTTKMERIINDLLDMSRLCNGRLALEPRTFELSHSVREVVSQVEATATSHRFVVEATRLVSVRADESRIEQVVTNLLTNAVRYSPDGGCITLKVHQTGSHAVIEVVDEGVGIASKHLKKIFERFHQGHVQTRLGKGGLGLGLWICNEIVALHDGHIEVESTENKGSVFRVHLPLDGATPCVQVTH